jgi:hypothetical protein
MSDHMKEWSAIMAAGDAAERAKKSVLARRVSKLEEDNEGFKKAFVALKAYIDNPRPLKAKPKRAIARAAKVPKKKR